MLNSKWTGCNDSRKSKIGNSSPALKPPKAISRDTPSSTNNKVPPKTSPRRPPTKPETPIPLSHKFTVNCGKRYTQFCRIKGCGGAECPTRAHAHTHAHARAHTHARTRTRTHTRIIFQRLKSPQQIIHRRKGNLLESPNHLKYRENILISRFYEQFSRSSRNLGHFWKFEKISISISSIIIDVFLRKSL